MPAPEVMLAATAALPPEQEIARLAAEGPWWFEVKLDGIRAVLTVTADAVVTITNRRGRDITHRYQDVVGAWEDSGFVGTLDGEIVVLVEGNPDFTAIHRRDAQTNARAAARLIPVLPALFVPFDVLDLNGEDVRPLGYYERHLLLVEAVGPQVASFAAQEGEAMWRVVLERGLEGLIAKRGTSPYRPGRQPSWVKLKATKRASVVATGIRPGKGSRAQVGSLEMGVHDEGGQLVYVGSVGSGMSASDLGLVARRLAGSVPLVIEVEYQEKAPSGKLRMPVFKGVRDDIPPEECTLAGLV